MNTIIFCLVIITYVNIMTKGLKADISTIDKNSKLYSFCPCLFMQTNPHVLLHQGECWLAWTNMPNYIQNSATAIRSTMILGMETYRLGQFMPSVCNIVDVTIPAVWWLFCLYIIYLFYILLILPIIF